MATVLGLALLAVAGVAAAYGAGRWRLWRALRAVEVTDPDRLTAAVRAGRQGSAIVGVMGLAAPGRDGLLTSTVNREPCVWHRHTVTNQQRLGRRRADWPSLDPFTLAGASARIAVLPRDLRVHRPRRRSDKFLPGLASEPFPSADALITANAAQYRHREWVIFPDTALFVLAQLSIHKGQIVLRRPARGPHIISTLPAGQLTNRTRTATLAAIAAVAPSLAAAVTVLVTR